MLRTASKFAQYKIVSEFSVKEKGDKYKSDRKSITKKVADMYSNSVFWHAENKKVSLTKFCMHLSCDKVVFINVTSFMRKRTMLLTEHLTQTKIIQNAQFARTVLSMCQSMNNNITDYKDSIPWLKTMSYYINQLDKLYFHTEYVRHSIHNANGIWMISNSIDDMLSKYNELYDYLTVVLECDYNIAIYRAVISLFEEQLNNILQAVGFYPENNSEQNTFKGCLGYSIQDIVTIMVLQAKLKTDETFLSQFQNDLDKFIVHTMIGNSNTIKNYIIRQYGETIFNILYYALIAHTKTTIIPKIFLETVYLLLPPKVDIKERYKDITNTSHFGSLVQEVSEYNSSLYHISADNDHYSNIDIFESNLTDVSSISCCCTKLVPLLEQIFNCFVNSNRHRRPNFLPKHMITQVDKLHNLDVHSTHYELDLVAHIFSLKYWYKYTSSFVNDSHDRLLQIVSYNLTALGANKALYKRLANRLFDTINFDFVQQVELELPMTVTLPPANKPTVNLTAYCTSLFSRTALTLHPVSVFINHYREQMHKLKQAFEANKLIKLANKIISNKVWLGYFIKLLSNPDSTDTRQFYDINPILFGVFKFSIELFTRLAAYLRLYLKQIKKKRDENIPLTVQEVTVHLVVNVLLQHDVRKEDEFLVRIWEDFTKSYREVQQLKSFIESIEAKHLNLLNEELQDKVRVISVILNVKVVPQYNGLDAKSLTRMLDCCNNILYAHKTQLTQEEQEMFPGLSSEKLEKYSCTEYLDGLAKSLFNADDYNQVDPLYKYFLSKSYTHIHYTDIDNIVYLLHKCQMRTDDFIRDEIIIKHHAHRFEAFSMMTHKAESVLIAMQGNCHTLDPIHPADNTITEYKVSEICILPTFFEEHIFALGVIREDGVLHQYEQIVDVDPPKLYEFLGKQYYLDIIKPTDKEQNIALYRITSGSVADVSIVVNRVYNSVVNTFDISYVMHENRILIKQLEYTDASKIVIFEELENYFSATKTFIMKRSIERDVPPGLIDVMQAACTFDDHIVTTDYNKITYRKFLFQYGSVDNMKGAINLFYMSSGIVSTSIDYCDKLNKLSKLCNINFILIHSTVSSRKVTGKAMFVNCKVVTRQACSNNNYPYCVLKTQYFTDNTDSIELELYTGAHTVTPIYLSNIESLVTKLTSITDKYEQALLIEDFINKPNSMPLAIKALHNNFDLKMKIHNEFINAVKNENEFNIEHIFQNSDYAIDSTVIDYVNSLSYRWVFYMLNATIHQIEDSANEMIHSVLTSLPNNKITDSSLNHELQLTLSTIMQPLGVHFAALQKTGILFDEYQKILLSLRGILSTDIVISVPNRMDEIAKYYKKCNQLWPLLSTIRVIKLTELATNDMLSFFILCNFIVYMVDDLSYRELVSNIIAGIVLRDSVDSRHTIRKMLYNLQPNIKNLLGSICKIGKKKSFWEVLKILKFDLQQKLTSETEWVNEFNSTVVKENAVFKSFSDSLQELSQKATILTDFFDGKYDFQQNGTNMCVMMKKHLCLVENCYSFNPQLCLRHFAWDRKDVSFKEFTLFFEAYLSPTSIVDQLSALEIRSFAHNYPSIFRSYIVYNCMQIDYMDSLHILCSTVSSELIMGGSIMCLVQQLPRTLGIIHFLSELAIHQLTTTDIPLLCTLLKFLVKVLHKECLHSVLLQHDVYHKILQFIYCDFLTALETINKRMYNDIYSKLNSVISRGHIYLLPAFINKEYHAITSLYDSIIKPYQEIGIFFIPTFNNLFNIYSSIVGVVNNRYDGIGCPKQIVYIYIRTSGKEMIEGVFEMNSFYALCDHSYKLHIRVKGSKKHKIKPVVCNKVQGSWFDVTDTSVLTNSQDIMRAASMPNIQDYLSIINPDSRYTSSQDLHSQFSDSIYSINIDELDEYDGGLTDVFGVDKYDGLPDSGVDGYDGLADEFDVLSKVKQLYKQLLQVDQKSKAAAHSLLDKLEVVVPSSKSKGKHAHPFESLDHKQLEEHLKSTSILPVLQKHYLLLCNLDA